MQCSEAGLQLCRPSCELCQWDWFGFLCVGLLPGTAGQRWGRQQQQQLWGMGCPVPAGAHLAERLFGPVFEGLGLGSILPVAACSWDRQVPVWKWSVWNDRLASACRGWVLSWWTCFGQHVGTRSSLLLSQWWGGWGRGDLQPIAGVLPCPVLPRHCSCCRQLLEHLQA